MKIMKQRAVLNCQVSTWNNVNAGGPQGSILGPLFFLIYIDGLSDMLSSNLKLFVNETSLFLLSMTIHESAGKLNEYLKKIGFLTGK